MTTRACPSRSNRPGKRFQRKHKPKYRRQPRAGGSDRAFVELCGRRYYLGDYGSPESKQEFRRLVIEWEARGRRPETSSADITVVELIDRFFDHVESYYRKPSGSPTSEVTNFRVALRAVKEHYGETEAGAFSPTRLKVVRAEMVERGWVRTTVNKAIWRIKSMFRWAVENELLDESVYGRLTVVRRLQAGRGGDGTRPAREPVNVEPVDDKHVVAIKEHGAPQIWAMVQLQLLSGARGGELFRLRPTDLDRRGDVWVATIQDRKTAYRGKRRLLYFGPAAQAIIMPFLEGRLDDSFLFSPAEAYARLRRAGVKGRRRQNQGDSPRKTRRRIGAHYTKDSYARAIKRACEKAGVPVWRPHQLRHAFVNRIEQQFDLASA